MKGADHSGHRQRMRNRYLNEGSLDNFEEHQILEMFLFYALPRRDTNELAHKMIKEFGNLDALINSPPEAIVSRTGVSLNTAVLISMVGKVHTRSSISKKIGIKLDTVEKVKQYCIELFKNKTTESFYIICLDKNKRIIAPVEIAKGSDSQVSVRISSMMSQINMLGTTAAFCAHNHPSGEEEFSIEDVRSTMIIKRCLYSYNIKLTDHILVCGDKAVSMVEKNKIKF